MPVIAVDRPAVEALGASRSLAGESPIWDAGRNALWWVDIRGQSVHRFALDGAERSWALAEQPGGLALGRHGTLFGAFTTGLFVLDPGRDAFVPASRPDALTADHRFNDVTVCPGGRLLAGTVRRAGAAPAPSGCLLAFDGSAWRTLAEGFWTINGLAFSPDGTTLYVSDSHPSVRRVWRHLYDASSGALGERMFFADLTGLAGRPDGAAVDRDGHYWVAGIDGGCLYRFAPGSGAMVEQRMLPVRRPSKPAFFGARLERMAVTSFAEQDPADPDSLDGALLGLDPGVPGVPVPPVAADAA